MVTAKHKHSYYNRDKPRNKQVFDQRTVRIVLNTGRRLFQYPPYVSSNASHPSKWSHITEVLNCGKNMTRFIISYCCGGYYLKSSWNSQCQTKMGLHTVRCTFVSLSRELRNCPHTNTGERQDRQDDCQNSERFWGRVILIIDDSSADWAMWITTKQSAAVL